MSHNDSLCRFQSVRDFMFRPNADTAGMKGLIIHLNRYLSIRAPFGEDVDNLCPSVLLAKS